MDLGAIRRAHRAGDGRPTSSFSTSPTASRVGGDVLGAATSREAHVPRSIQRASTPPWGAIITGTVLIGLVLGGGLMMTVDSGSKDNGASPTASSSTAPAGPATAPSGKWVLVLESLPQASTTLPQADAQAQRLSTEDRSVLVIDSSATPGLNAGYWALVLMPFETRARAAAACADMGRALGGACYPRHIE